MRTTLSLLVLAPLAIALQGCCNGPLVHVDCVPDEIWLDFEVSGEAVEADLVTYAYEGVAEGGNMCFEPCTSAVIPLQEEGLYTVYITMGDQNWEREFDMVRPGDGGCCGDVMTLDETIELTPSE